MTRRETQDLYEEINQILENLNKSDEQRKREKEEAEKARLLEEERKRNLVVRNTSGINGGEYKEDDLYAIPFETIDDFKRRIENANEKELRNERSLIKRNNTKLAHLKEDFKHYKKISKKLKLWEFQRIGDASLRSFLYNIVLVLFVNIVTPFSVGLADLYIFAYIYSLLKEPIKEFRKVRKERSRCSEFLEGLNKEKRKIVDEKIEEIEKEYKNSLLEIKLKEEQEETKIKDGSIGLFDDFKDSIFLLKHEEDRKYFINLLRNLLIEYQRALNNLKDEKERCATSLMSLSLSKSTINRDLTDLIINIELAVKDLLAKEKDNDSKLKDIDTILKSLGAESINKNELNLDVSFEYKQKVKNNLEEQLKVFIEKYNAQNIRNNCMVNVPILNTGSSESSIQEEDRSKVKYKK